MPLKRYVTEMGMGIDVHGGDYTKAARRAISDAIRHSSLNFFAHTDKSHDEMQIQVKLGVGNPDAIDDDAKAAIAAELPYGHVTVFPEKGGLDVPGEHGDIMVIATVAILVCFDEP